MAVAGALRFEPYLRPLVWGGRQLALVLGKTLPTEQAYGESWEISDHASHASVVAEGPYRGQTLRQLLERSPRALFGSAAETYPTFPWLVKLLDAWDWLSVQVHPPEHLVGRLWPGENSKTEAWFILSAPPGSRIYAGLQPGVDEARLRAALNAGTVAECLHSFEPRPGDCIFLRSGTVHAVGGGVLMAEVQQTSDATFRLFDWNRVDAQGRSRTLHIEEALACIDWTAGPVHPVRAAGYASPTETVRQQLLRCRYFHLEYLCDSRSFSLGGTGRLQVLVVLHGAGLLETPEGSMSLHTGDSLLLPATLPACPCRPDGTLGLLLSTLPE
jgi:mannose-6-phosphate isomerase